MYTGKGTLDYRAARQASRMVRENNNAAFKFADGLASRASGGRERSEGCAQDGVEHSVLNYAGVKPEGFWKLFCAHEHPYWKECMRCGRGKAEAEKNWEKHQLGTLNVVPQAETPTAFATKVYENFRAWRRAAALYYTPQEIEAMWKTQRKNLPALKPRAAK